MRIEIQKEPWAARGGERFSEKSTAIAALFPAPTVPKTARWSGVSLASQCQLAHVDRRSKGQVRVPRVSPISWGSVQGLSITDRPYLALGLEGSANKLGAGIIRHGIDGSSTVLSNVRHTYITPPGEGFLPRDTAVHHRQWALKVIEDAVTQSGVGVHDLDCICFTKGPFIFYDCTWLLKLQHRAWYGGSAAISCPGRSDAVSSV